jgi:hypothetical protein
MNNRTLTSSLRLSAALLLVGQLLYFVITLFHTGGPANDHPTIFAAYAGSGSWTVVHIAQFACMAILIAGLLVLSFALDAGAGTASWVGRLGAASAVVALALEGALQAVDGVANKQADLAWISAPDAEKAARFASAEAIRWIEWGMRSYQAFALGVALLLFAAAVVRLASVPRPIPVLMGGSLRLRLAGAGLGGRLRRLLSNDVGRDRACRSPGPRVDALAARRRLADAGFGRPSTG